MVYYNVLLAVRYCFWLQVNPAGGLKTQTLSGAGEGCFRGLL